MSTIGQTLCKIELRHDLKTDALVDMDTHGKSEFFRSAGVRLELNLTRNNELVDVSNVVSATVEVLSTNVATGTLAMAQTITRAAGQIDNTVTLAEHQAKTAGRAHFAFTFSDAETADAVFGSPADPQEHWIVVYGILDGSASRVVFGCGTLYSRKAGITGAVGVPAAGGQAVSLAEVLALVGSFVPYNVPAGKAVRFLGTGADGKAVAIALQLVIDPAQGPVLAQNLEIEQ